MRLISDIEISDFRYFLVLDDTKSAQRWFLFSEIHPENFAKLGKARYENSLTLKMLTSKSRLEYMTESISRSKKTGEIKAYGRTPILDKVMQAFIEARDFSYPKDSIFVNETRFDPLPERDYTASYGGRAVSFRQEEGLYSKLEFSTPEISVNLQSNFKIKIPQKIPYETIDQAKVRNNADVVSIDKVDFKALNSMIDLSWYWDKDTGVRKKDYKAIHSIVEFEVNTVTPMIRKIIENQKNGIKTLIGCDIESTGFGLLDLSATNPSKDFMTTIQLSWDDDMGRIMFFHMKYFKNVDLQYVLKRLYPLFKYGATSTEFELIYDEEGNEINEVVTVLKEWYELTGHNSSFDSRGTLSEGYQFFFDHDTLQMAFNINPTVIKGSKGLKHLVKRFLGVEMPELGELLGKGNEGKFHYLSDEEVARIYGCADVDQARQIFKFLRGLMSDKMFKSYSQLDPITWYLTAQSEYYGMTEDVDLIDVVYRRLKKDLKTIEETIYSYVGAVLSHRVTMMMNGKLDMDDDLDVSLEGHRYVFKLKGDELRHVMYKQLKYPVLVKTKKGDAAVNKEAIQKLLYKKNAKSSNILKEDIKSDNGEVLVKAELFNSYKYPLCYLLRVFADLTKEYDTYYKPMEEEDLEGRLFKRISTTNVETRRLSSAAQILKKSVKDAIIPYNEDYYLGDWDLAQVEDRWFTSEAGDMEGIKRSDNPESDVHTSNASLMFGILPHLISKLLRTMAKAFGFGIPYGLSDFKLTERLFTVYNEENALQTRILKAKFESAKAKTMKFLKSIRESALIPRDLPKNLRDFLGLKEDDVVSMVYNKNGFYRYFILNNVLGDRKREEAIGRQAGNYPIQSGTADLYRLLLKRFTATLEKYGIRDKIIFHMYIHDELLFSIHKSIDPRLIAKIVQESCVVRVKGHTKYYVGLNFGHSWGDCKKDINEIPALLLERMHKEFSTYELNSWTDNPKEIIMPMIEKYKRTRVLEVMDEIQPNFREGCLDIKNIAENFTNYMVRSYTYENSRAYEPRKIYSFEEKKDITDDTDNFLSCLCTLLIKEELENVSVLVDDKVYTAKEYSDMRIASTVVSEVEIDLEDMFDESDNLDEIELEETGDAELDYWSFDENESEMYEHVSNMYFDDTEDEDSKLFEVKPKEFKHITRLNKVTKVYLTKRSNSEKIKEFLKPYMMSGGDIFMIETPIGTTTLAGRYKADLDSLDNLLDELNSSKKGGNDIWQGSTKTERKM
jgi:DNA polymerase I-like protein with 3'-5' exonuclease and polymerase domains